MALFELVAGQMLHRVKHIFALIHKLLNEFRGVIAYSVLEKCLHDFEVVYLAGDGPDDGLDRQEVPAG